MHHNVFLQTAAAGLHGDDVREEDGPGNASGRRRWVSRWKRRLATIRPDVAAGDDGGRQALTGGHTTLRC